MADFNLRMQRYMLFMYLKETNFNISITPWENLSGLRVGLVFLHIIRPISSHNSVFCLQNLKSQYSMAPMRRTFVVLSRLYSFHFTLVLSYCLSNRLIRGDWLCFSNTLSVLLSLKKKCLDYTIMLHDSVNKLYFYFKYITII